MDLLARRTVWVRTILAWAVLLGAAWAPAQEAGVIEGTVVDQSGEPVREATILALELKRSARVDASGAFRFEDVRPGVYTLQAQARGFGTSLVTTEVAAGGRAEVRIQFDLEVHEDLTVTAAPERKSVSDVSQAVGVVDEDELMVKMQPTLGETLAEEPGVSSTGFGQGSSRPIIRGLGGERIRILEDGLESGDVSTVSVDHAIAIDPISVERVEILRGPASLRYGSTAVGGVVNVIDNRIPEFLPDRSVAGVVELRGGTAADDRAAGARLNGGAGRVAWHVDFFSTDADDYDIPGEPELEEEGEEHEEEEPFTGKLENSAVETLKGTAGASYIGSRGFVGVAYSGFDTEYGIPGHGHAHEEEGDEHDHEEEEGGEEENVTIDLEQRRFDLRGEYRFETQALKAVNFRVGGADYEHRELEGAEVGTTFLNEYREARAELTHGGYGAVTSGAIGLQYSNRDFEAFGAEAFVPPSDTDKLGVFFYQEVDRDGWSVNFGGRFENQTNQATALEGHGHEDDEHGHEEDEHDHEGEEDEHEGEEPEAFDLDFNGVSASVGLVLARNQPWGVSINLARTERLPTPEELFSNGPHLATDAFEVGDPNLDKEVSTGLDVVLRRKEGAVRGELSLFYNRFEDFIFEQETGDIRDGLTEFIFLQEDADFWGGELHVDADLLHSEPHHVTLEFSYDLVRAELDSGANLPRITPSRWHLGLRYARPQFWVKGDVRRVDEQDRIAAFETATDGYTMAHLAAAYRFFVGTSVHEVMLRGRNLTDEDARNHSSFLKDRILLPGRDISLAYRLKF